MSSFNAVNHNGSYFAAQITNGDLDPFAVFGLHADDQELSKRGVRSHYRKVVMPHVFQRGSQAAATAGPRVPTWTQVNMAKDMLLEGSKTAFEELKTAWSQKSQQVWDPFAELGSDEAMLARTDRTVPPEYHAPDVEEVQDEYDAERLAREAREADDAEWAEAFGAADAADAAAGSRMDGEGTEEEPFVFGSDEDAFGSDNPTASTLGATAGRRRRRAPPRPQSPASANPPSGSRRRLKPRGILVGTWKRSGLHAASSNAVYASRDIKNRINRRISKEDGTGKVVHGGNFDVRVTACKHEDIDYIQRFSGMTKEEVDSWVMPLLLAADQAARHRQASPSRLPTDADPAAPASSQKFSRRGISFFVDEEGDAFPADWGMSI